MKHTVACLILNLAFAGALNAQYLFTQVNTNMVPMGYSRAIWGDIDNDGDLDVAVAGESALDGTMAKIYRNDAGTFHDLNAGLTGIQYPSLEFGDYDQDGDLDLLLTGLDSLSQPVTKIYKNSSGSFSDSGIPLPGVYDGAGCWGDFDNDGDLDILLSGTTVDFTYISKILRNDGNTQFNDIGAPLMGFQMAFACWVDYNNDGQQDAMVGGDSGGGMFTKLYKNDHGSFTEIDYKFMGLSDGQAKWGDLDKDGDNDLIIVGSDLYSDGHVAIYQNTGNDEFIENLTFEVNLISSFVETGDYDNDGKLDYMLMGKYPGCGGTVVTILNHNDGDMVFSEVTTLIPGIKKGSIQFGDYNNDGWHDILLTGYTQTDSYATWLYRNPGGSSGFSTNTPPAQPNGINAEVADNNVTFSWERSTDAQTPSAGLTYNVYIGNSPGEANIFSPMSDLSNGFRQTVINGNCSHDTSWGVNDLSNGDYYWSVQAIDNGYMGSGFAPSGTFTIDYVGISDPAVTSASIYPNPCKDKVYINDPAMTGAMVTVMSSLGKIILRQAAGTADLSDCPGGVYLIELRDADKTVRYKLIKE